MNEPWGTGQKGASILGALVVALMLGTTAVVSFELATPTFSEVSGSSQVAAPCTAALIVKKLPCSEPAAAPKVAVPSVGCTTIRSCSLESKKIGNILEEKCVPGFIYKISKDGDDIKVDASLNTRVANKGPCKGAGAAPASTKKTEPEKTESRKGKKITCSEGDLIEGNLKPGVSATCVIEDCRDKEKNKECKTLSVKGGTSLGSAQKLADSLRDHNKLTADLKSLDKNVDHLKRCVVPGKQVQCEGLQVPEDFLSRLEDGKTRRTELQDCFNGKVGGCTSQTHADALRLLAQQENKAEATEEKLYEVKGRIASLADIAAKGRPESEADPCPGCTPKEREFREKYEKELADLRGRGGGGDERERRNDTFGRGEMKSLADLLKALNGPQQTPNSGSGTHGQPPRCTYNSSYDSSSYNSGAPVNCQCQGGLQVQNGICSGPQGQNCPTAPQQPDPAGCSGGSWRPTYAGICLSSWQCVPGGGGGGPTAQLVCQPQVVDAGTALNITYSCSAGTSIGAGFTTNSAQSGATTTIVAAPPGNTNIATYGLTCIDQGRSGTAQCSVQVARPSIVLVAIPNSLKSGEQSALGWVTTGIQSCVISSPDLPAFTAANANNTNANGTATTPPLTASTTVTYNFLLSCQTLGGNSRQASTTISASP